MIQEVITLFRKEIALEYRNRQSVSAILLYLAGTVFIVYLSFQHKANQLQPLVWNALFWIIQLFMAVTAATRAFSGERSGRQWYYYYLVNPRALVFAKALYYSCLSSILGIAGYAVFATVISNPVQDLGQFLVAIVLGHFSFAISLTMTAGIASLAQSNTTLMPVLSFPLLLPQLLMTLSISKNAIDGLGWEFIIKEVSILAAIAAILLVVSQMLFPYLWRSQSN